MCIRDSIHVICNSNPGWDSKPERYHWSPALFEEQDVLLQRDDRPAIRDFAELRGKTLGTVSYTHLKILFTLEKKGYISLHKGDTESLVNIALNKEELPSGFLSKEVFKSEYMNCEKFKRTIQRSTAITLDTFLSKTYRDRGIKIWEV